MGSPERVRIGGPLAPFADGFGARLKGLGYSRFTVEAQLQLMAHVSAWLEDCGVGADQLTRLEGRSIWSTDARAGMFIAARRARWGHCWRICVGWVSRRPRRR